MQDTLNPQTSTQNPKTKKKQKNTGEQEAKMIQETKCGGGHGSSFFIFFSVKADRGPTPCAAPPARSQGPVQDLNGVIMREVCWIETPEERITVQP